MGLGRLVMFLLISTSILLAVHAYCAWRLSSTVSQPWKAALWGIAVAFAFVHPVAFASRTVWKAPWADALSWVSYVGMGLFSLLFILTVLRDLGWLGANLVGMLPPDPARRQALLQLTSAGVVGAAAAMSGVGWVQARSRVGIVDVTVPIANLPADLEGFTIAQITDIHVGPTIKRGFIENIVADVNSIDADLIAVTGDIVDGSVDDLSEHTAPLAHLRAKHGVFFVTGNHEYYSGALQWIEELTRLGMRALNNAHHVISEKLVVAGVTDISAKSILPDHASDPHKAIAGAPVDAIKILLAHQPRSAFEAAKAGFHLQLSGHTHGGQFFPWSLVVHLAQPYVVGLHRLNDLWVYVSRGTGYWGPPNRLGVPAEITRITLARA